MNAFSGLKEIGLFFFFSPNITYHATGYYVIFPLPEYALWVSMKEKNIVEWNVKGRGCKCAKTQTPLNAFVPVWTEVSPNPF